MITSIPITELRNKLNVTFFYDVATSITVTALGHPVGFIATMPRSEEQLELIKSELDDLYRSQQYKSKMKG